MKKIISGGFLLLSGVILYLGVHIPAAIRASQLGGWSTPPGRLGTALNEMGGIVPTQYSIFMMILGCLLILLGSFSDELKKVKKMVFRKSEKE